MAIKVCSSEFCFSYGNEIRFPYSIAILLSYCQADTLIANNCRFEKTFLFRDRINDYIRQAKDCDILLCSCYIWNWEITLILAQEIKKINPGCFIVFGGPNIPGNASQLLKNHPFIDVVVHGEGEQPLRRLLRAYNEGTGDFRAIEGIQTREYHNGLAERLVDLNVIPSPYLSNLIWELVEQRAGFEYIASWETNRGCPFSCIFCDWGSYLKSKIRTFDNERLFEEAKWFSDNKINYIDVCDANFGILYEKNLALAKELCRIKNETGYPVRMRPSWTKTSSDKVISIAKVLHECSLVKAVTLALQSLDTTTLENIQRKNLPFDKYSELTKKFKANNVPTYTEIIMGLPGETLKSYKNGLDNLMAGTDIGTIYTYNCTLIVNSEIASEACMEKYKIKTMRSPIYLTHSAVQRMEIQEYEDIVTGSYSYDLNDLKQMFLYSWMVQTFFSFGILDQVMRFYKNEYGISYMNFFDELLLYTRSKTGSLLNMELNLVEAYIDKGYAGAGWDHNDVKLGGINWSIEEGSWLRFVENGEMLRTEIQDFLFCLENKFHAGDEKIRDLVKFQIFLLTTKDDSREIKSAEFSYDWKGYFLDNTLRPSAVQYHYTNKVLSPDPVQWNYEAIWYGRAQRKYKALLEEINASEIDSISRHGR